MKSFFEEKETYRGSAFTVYERDTGVLVWAHLGNVFGGGWVLRQAVSNVFATSPSWKRVLLGNLVELVDFWWCHLPTAIKREHGLCPFLVFLYHSGTNSYMRPGFFVLFFLFYFFLFFGD